MESMSEQAAAPAAPAWKPRDPAVASYSGLKLLKRSPRHYLAWCNEPPKEPTRAMVLGTAVHHAVLEPLEFAARYVIQPDFGDMRSSTSRARRDEWAAGLPKRTTVLSRDDHALCCAMRDAVQTHTLARDLLISGHAEGRIEWTDRDTGLRCVGRPDFIVEELGLCIELKTTMDASPIEFGKSTANMLYDLQGVMYLDGLRAIGKPMREHLILCVESEPPHEVALYRLDDSAIERGALMMTRLLEQLRECVRTNEWPGYGEGIQTLTLPGWAFSA